jgi:hypothetical protein
MKTTRLSIAFAAALLSATSFTGKVSAFVNLIPMDIPERTLVQLTSPSNVSASIYFYDGAGKLLLSDKIHPESSTKLYDFSNLPDGVYTFESQTDQMNITKKLVIKDSKVEILSKETEFKPYFSVDENEMKVSFVNQDQKAVEFSIENDQEVFYQGNGESDFHFKKMLDISNLMFGEYYAKLKVGAKTYYHYFNVN